jgi:ectoine hydroxylase-related dioxygenase (phytanoyl-CoA dioxygenase family)
MTILNKKILSTENVNNDFLVESFNDSAQNQYSESSIYFAKHQDEWIVNEIRHDVKSYFNNSTDYYVNLLIDDYRDIVKATQDLLNQKNVTYHLCKQLKAQIQEYIGEEKFFIQSNLYLRATRPYVNMNTEKIGWHRETFYGPNMEKSVNLWTPILDVNSKNTLQYIPFSQNIPEHEIITNNIIDEVTSKGSTGNIIGFLYSPKEIVSGVNLNNASKMIVPEFHSSLFSGLLIHGSGTNQSENIRFSIDFRILPFTAYNYKKSKHFHFASNKPYFELFID